jgi:plastocyanin
VYYDNTLQALRIYPGNIANGKIIADRNWVAAQLATTGGSQPGVAGKIAYYSATGTQVNDLTELSWTADTSTLLLSGTINVTGQKNRIRFHWDTLADLTSEVPAADYHGMVAHAHDTGKLYYAHAGAWLPVASEAAIPNTFSTIAVAGQNSLAADSPSTTLTLVAGTGITLTTNAGTETLTITGTASTGNITFAANVIDTTDSTAISFTPSVAFDSDVVVGNEIVFSDGTRQRTSSIGITGPQGIEGPPGASGAGTGDVLSAGGAYVDNSIVRYNGTTGTIIQVSSASVSDAGVLSATNFSGGGAAITALNATQLTTGTVPNARFPATLPAASGINLTALNAAQLTTGTVPDARFPATLPAASGTNLTALNAAQLTTGTVPIGRIGASGTPSASTYLRGDNAWATVSGGVSSNSFETIVVAGQISVVADSATDSLTLVAGSGIVITTDAGTDSVTITATAGGGGTVTTASVVSANGFAGTVTTASTTPAITISTSITGVLKGNGTAISAAAAGTDYQAVIALTTSGTSGAATFNGTILNIPQYGADVGTFSALTDASTAGATVDEFYLPAITALAVTNNGASSYRFDQYSTADNPTIYAISGTTIAFRLSVSGHPFLIRTAGGSNYDTGLNHVTTTGTVTTGSSAQGKVSGTLYWKIPAGISGNYQYICSIHGGMVGVIAIKDISAI